MRKFKKRWLLVLVFISILSASAFNRRYKKVGAEGIEATEVSYYKKPTGDATKFLGIWLTSGYVLQPQENTYIEVGQTKTLRGEAGRSAMLQAITLPYIIKKYQWYKSTDGQKWSKVSSKESGNKQNFPITPKEEGTTYYQLDVYFETLFGVTTAAHLYSNVATVHAVPEPVDATDVKVTTDDDYLYNSDNELINNETYAHAHPTPANFTGTITWSISDTNLATIDPDSGLITANTNRKGGKVTVTATMHNPVGKDITGDTEITIGGGLEDQTVKAGETATFDLRGNISELDDETEDNDYTIKWYKEDPITQVRTQIQKDKPQALEYTTPETTLDDEGTIILAIIQVRYNGKSYSYTTNDAYLHVIPEGGPNISMTNSLSNETFNDGSNTEQALFGVNNGDVVKYSDKVTNESTSGTLKDASYTLPLRQGTRVSSIQIDGEEVDQSKYQMVKNDDTGSTDLVISGLSFKINESHQIDIETVVAGIEQKTSYQAVPYVTGKNDENKEYSKFGNDLELNYTTDTVVIKKVNDIDYGSINAYGSNKTVARQSELNLPNNVMELEDTRRNKKAVTVTVSQNSPLQTDAGDILNGHLRFYNNGNYQDLMTHPAVIAETKDNEELLSLGWEEDNGVLLFLEAKMNLAGTYKTTLNWSISDSV